MKEMNDIVDLRKDIIRIEKKRIEKRYETK